MKTTPAASLATSLIASVPAKRAWVAPQISLLDADETMSGNICASEMVSVMGCSANKSANASKATCS
ncbi:MAG: hypothetical protein RLZZ15_2102 [Verrucomicrobiota bacterium]